MMVVYTSVVEELDVGLGTICEENSVLGVHPYGLGVEINGQIEVVIDEGLFGFLLQI